MIAKFKISLHKLSIPNIFVEHIFGLLNTLCEKGKYNIYNCGMFK